MIKNEEHANVCTLKPGAASHKVLNSINCIHCTYVQEQKCPEWQTQSFEKKDVDYQRHDSALCNIAF